MLKRALIVGATALLGACTSVPLTRPAPVTAPSTTAAVPPAPGTAPAGPAATLQREHARWTAAEWQDLPGWGGDAALEAWAALQRGCARPAPEWTAVCAEALRDAPRDDADAMLWLMQHLRPWRVEAPDGNAQGLATGYFEPELAGAARAGGANQVPVLAPPRDLWRRQPYLTRRQLDEGGGAALDAIAYVADPLELAIAQVQGSGRLRLDGADGRPQWLRLSYAGDNGLPYQSIGAALRARGELADASWAGVRDWARRNPGRLREALWANPRYVFFRAEALADPALGPRGAQGVALTPGRSVAVDKLAVPLGTPLWLDTSAPLSDQPLRRLVLAQDTGSAIQGAVRVDLFWGWGADAEALASRMKQALRVWALWPRTAGPLR
ncbi:MAG: MltA domain-containing protein [Pelomonas sp.]|nr:MltA domain-containing protein [Roseateles sp.]